MALRFVHFAALIVVASTIAGSAFAANPEHVKRAKNTRQIAECVRCDLSNADMRNGFFQLANLIEADLSGGKFDGANMAGVQLGKANLSKASFVYTNLSGARMDGADLRGANFRNAWFNWAWFHNAKLDGADFTNAKFIGAQLHGADLRNVIGLTSSQLRNACADAFTQLPPGIAQPRCPY